MGKYLGLPALSLWAFLSGACLFFLPVGGGGETALYGAALLAGLRFLLFVAGATLGIVGLFVSERQLVSVVGLLLNIFGLCLTRVWLGWW